MFTDFNGFKGVLKQISYYSGFLDNRQRHDYL